MCLLSTIFLFPLVAAKTISHSHSQGYRKYCFNDTTLIVEDSSEILVEVCQYPTAYCDFFINACVDGPSSFHCHVDGLYPHATDCNGSFSCSNGKIMNHPCPAKTYFDYKKKRCRRSTVCRKANCRNKVGLFVQHPADESLYVHCIDEFLATVMVCPVGYRFSGGSVPPCEFVCRGAGVYSDVYNEDKYYECVWQRERLIKSERYCPAGHVFNNNKGSVYCTALGQNPTMIPIEDSSYSRYRSEDAPSFLN